MTRFLSAREVAELLSISRVHVWRKVADGTLPAPVYVGPKAPRWREDELTAWQDRCSAKQPTAA